LHVTDGQTDEQNYDSQDRASISAALRVVLGVLLHLGLQFLEAHSWWEWKIF